MKNIRVPGSDEEVIPQVFSDMLDMEVSSFLCIALYACNDEELYTRYLTELSGEGRDMIKRVHGRLSTLLERDTKTN